MSKPHVILIYLFLLVGSSLFAKSGLNTPHYRIAIDQIVIKTDTEFPLFYQNTDTTTANTTESRKAHKKLIFKEKLISIGLCIALGPFGVHRLYLGTTEKVPILYTLTLGGGFGVLPLIDLFTILITKDLNKYKNNSNIFLWTPQEKEND